MVQEKDLTSKFSQYGKILHVMVTRDPETKASKYDIVSLLIHIICKSSSFNC